MRFYENNRDYKTNLRNTKSEKEREKINEDKELEEEREVGTCIANKYGKGLRA